MKSTERIKGWICPICGRGLAPWIPECGCFREKDTGGITENSEGGVEQADPEDQFPADEPIPEGTIDDLLKKLRENKRETCAKVADALDADEMTEQETEEVCRRIEGKKAKPKKEIDVGRIRALHKAGWKAKDIADDVGCSEPTVYKYIRK